MTGPGQGHTLRKLWCWLDCRTWTLLVMMLLPLWWSISFFSNVVKRLQLLIQKINLVLNPSYYSGLVSMPPHLLIPQERYSYQCGLTVSYSQHGGHLDRKGPSEPLSTFLSSFGWTLPSLQWWPLRMTLMAVRCSFHSLDQFTSWAFLKQIFLEYWVPLTPQHCNGCCGCRRTWKMRCLIFHDNE